MTDEPVIVPLHRHKKQSLDASDWLAKLDRGALSPDERAAFGLWLTEDPKNRDAIKEAAAFWYGLNAPFSEPGAFGYPSPQGAKSTLRFPPRARRLAAGFKIAAIAASLLIAAGIVSILNIPSHPSDEASYFATNIGETRSVSLSDGSEITLNTNSIAEQDFSKKERIVRLVSGEAIFDVAHDEGRPFLVYASDSMIRAVGTRFSVRVEPDKVSVTVTEGRIAILERSGQQGGQASQNRAASPVMVDEGEAGEIDRTAGAVKQPLSDRDVAERLSWAKGQLIFYDKDLQSVVDEIARYTTVEIEIPDETLRIRKVTGVFQIGDINIMLEGIESALDVKSEWMSPNRIVLTAG